MNCRDKHEHDHRHNHDCGCSNKSRPDYVDVSRRKVVPYDEIATLMGFDVCGKMSPVEKPEAVDKLIIDGDGDRALFDDGQYKEVLTSEEAENVIADKMKDYVKYEDDKVNFRDSVFLKNGMSLSGLSLDKNAYNLIKRNVSDNTEVGHINMSLLLVSDVRPSVRMRTESGMKDSKVAFIDDIPAVPDITELENTVQRHTDEIADLKSKDSSLANDIKGVSDNLDTTNKDVAKNTSDITQIKADNNALEGRVSTNEDNIVGHEGRIDALESGLSDTNSNIVNLNNELFDTNNKVSDNATNIADLQTKVSDNTVKIGVNTEDIINIKKGIAETEHFRGYFETTDEVLDLANPTEGDYAWNAKTGTVWTYTGITWKNSGVNVPDQTVPPSNITPEMDGAGSAGISTQYSRGDHKHPTDTTRAAKTELDATNVNLTNIGNELNNYKSLNDSIVNSIDALSKVNRDKIAIIESDLSTVTGDVSGLKSKTESLDNSVSDLNTKVSTNTTNISSNTQEIENLKNSFSNQVSFRGYFQTNAQITSLPNPKSGDYAWSAESGTVWTYTGVTWADTSEPIPDQNIGSYESIPEMDGVGSAGTVELYSRGNHKHPSDATKADKVELDALSSRVDSIGGDLDSYKISNDSKIADVENNLSLAKTDIVKNSDDITTLKGKVSANETNISANSNDINLAKGRISIVEDATAENTTNITSIHQSLTSIIQDVDTNKTSIADLSTKVSTLEGDVSGHETRITSNRTDIDALTGRMTTAESKIDANTENITNISNTVSDHTTKIQTNTDDIASINSRLNNSEHFRGYVKNTSDLDNINEPHTNDYAWNAETGTVWNYNGTAWVDTGAEIPDTSVEASNSLPLVAGVADAGTSNLYSRGDHRHPADPNKADKSEIPINVSQLTNDVGYITNSSIGDFISKDDVDALLLDYIKTSTFNTEIAKYVSIQSLSETLLDYAKKTDLSEYAKKTEVPTRTSDITNDSDFIDTSALLPYAKIVDVPSKTSDLNNDNGFITLSDVDLSGYLQLSGGTLTGHINTFNLIPNGTGRNIGYDSNRYSNVYTNAVNTLGVIIGGVDKTASIASLTNSGDGTKYLADDGTYKTVDVSGFLPLTGGTMTGLINARRILPAENNLYDLGNTALQWNCIHVQTVFANGVDQLQRITNLESIVGTLNDYLEAALAG